jgi:hypothetical protein
MGLICAAGVLQVGACRMSVPCPLQPSRLGAPLMILTAMYGRTGFRILGLSEPVRTDPAVPWAGRQMARPAPERSYRSEAEGLQRFFRAVRFPHRNAPDRVPPRWRTLLTIRGSMIFGSHRCGEKRPCGIGQNREAPEVLRTRRDGRSRRLARQAARCQRSTHGFRPHERERRPSGGDRRDGRQPGCRL